MTSRLTLTHSGDVCIKPSCFESDRKAYTNGKPPFGSIYDEIRTIRNYNDVGVNFFIDSLRYAIIPCLLIFVFNLLIIFGMAKSRQERRAVSAVPKDEKSDNVLVNLFLVSFFYIIFNIPRTVIWIYYEILKSRAGDVDPSMDWAIINYYYIISIIPPWSIQWSNEFCELLSEQFLFDVCVNWVITSDR
jgi:hypothetical protein